MGDWGNEWGEDFIKTGVCIGGDSHGLTCDFGERGPIKLPRRGSYYGSAGVIFARAITYDEYRFLPLGFGGRCGVWAVSDMSDKAVLKYIFDAIKKQEADDG